MFITLTKCSDRLLFKKTCLRLIAVIDWYWKIFVFHIAQSISVVVQNKLLGSLLFPIRAMQQKLTGISHNFQFAIFHAELVKIDADRVKCYVLRLLRKFWCQKSLSKTINTWYYCQSFLVLRTAPKLKGFLPNSSLQKATFKHFIWKASYRCNIIYFLFFLLVLIKRLAALVCAFKACKAFICSVIEKIWRFRSLLRTWRKQKKLHVIEWLPM